MGDISNLCTYGWYEWVYFRQSTAPFPMLQEELGRCLGPTKNEGNEMCQWVLQKNGQIVPRATLRRLTRDESSPFNEPEARKRAEFDAAIREKLGDSMMLGPAEHTTGNLVHQTEEFDFEDPTSVLEFNPDEFIPYEDEVEAPAVMPHADLTDSSGKPINQQSMTDLLINAEVLLPQGESEQLAKVLRRSVDEEGKLIGTFNDNPILNTLVYEVEFPDGTVKEYAANIIAENILRQVDPFGRYTHVMDGIIGHKKNDHALEGDDAFVVTRRGQRKLRQTTRGWDFQVQWRDGTTQWLPLKDLKESNPVDVAEYAVARGIADELSLIHI
jgi:hypothetical protein